MTHRRPKPGSFQDDLGDVIERIAPADVKSKPGRQKTPERRISNSAELNDRLFENAWSKKR